jgi:hypothetical protein
MADPGLTHLLRRLDAALSELHEVRAELRAAVAGAEADDESDDFAPEYLVEISAAVERFNRPADTIRYWCRHEECGIKRGGRWLASARRIERRLNGE